MSKGMCVALVVLACWLTVAAQDSSPNAKPAGNAADATTQPQSSDSNSQPAKTDGTDHKWHLRLGAIGVGAGYFHGPALYPYPGYGYPFYSAAFWDPFWGPYYPAYAPDLNYDNGKGEVRLTGAAKDAKVYLDGAYAGTADRLKHMWLDPGAYNLSVDSPGRETFQQRIYVLSGKTIKVAANHAPNVPGKEKP
jgi:hypothetical protein